MNRVVLPRSALALAFALALAAPPVALACGETLFRTGSGMRYQSETRPATARILMVADTSRAREAYRAKLYGGLRQAGHAVTEVPNAQALGDALAADPYDLVVAHQSEIDRVLAALQDHGAAADRDGDASTPQLIPVLARDGTRDELTDTFRICLREDASVRQVLRAVGRAMRARMD